MEFDKIATISRVTAEFKVQYETMGLLFGVFKQYVGTNLDGIMLGQIGSADYARMFFDMVNDFGMFYYCLIGNVGDELYEKIKGIRESCKAGKLKLLSVDTNGCVQYLDDGRIGKVNMLEVMHEATLVDDDDPDGEPDLYSMLCEKYEYKLSADAVMHALNTLLAKDDAVHAVVHDVKDISSERVYKLVLHAFDEKGYSIINNLTRSINNDSLGRRSEVL